MTHWRRFLHAGVGCCLGLGLACQPADASAPTPGGSLASSVAARPLVLSGLPVFESVALMRLAEAAPPSLGPVEFVPWRTPDQLMVRVAADEVDFGIFAANQPAILAQRGLHVRVVRVLLAAGNLAFLTTRPGEDLRDALSGANVVAPFPHGLPAIIVSELLGEAGRVPDRDLWLKFVEGPLDAVALLAARRADVAFLAEPIASVAEETLSGLEIRRWSVDDLWRTAQPDVPLVVSVLAAVGAAADDPALQRAIGREFDAALALSSEDSAPGVALSARHFPQLPARALASGLERVRVTALPPASQCASWMLFLRWVAARDLSLVGGQLPGADACLTP